MFRNHRKLIVQILRYVISCGLIFFVVKFLLVGDESRPIPKLNDLKKLMIEAENENSKRLLSVKNTCKKYNLGIYKEIKKISPFKHPPAPQYSVFYIARSRDLSYCPIYKAGSTTWIYNLCLLMNVTEEELNSGKEQISTIARRAIPELEFPEADEALRTTKKLLVVRHPFERLLSAYRDKLENSVAGREHGTLHFYRKYGCKIVEKYREKNFTRPRDDQVIRTKDIPPPAGIEPTFREFVQYVIHTDLANYGDDHWMPYYLFCAPCVVDYDIIGKVETLWRDQIYTIHKLGLQKVIKPRWRHGGGYSNTSKIYFSQLNRDMVEKMYEKFKLDFELFDYSPDDYYQYAFSA
ncbi:Carbohydrate sulfotransferase 11 [Habropoda laboriosa]|uniref:Carbohydrate sulfotransferase n=1 Tax=Habropoda laboriosa TaxID=597456 RepID=A0A0L7R5W6_9HYME|nr:PREDICTED: carbohydrate sulfotransferase 11-like [Habropoda laboriosa]KOC66265.1 Carbohydrate sulfotransferase 11 [Habropoda laboriosa]